MSFRSATRTAVMVPLLLAVMACGSLRSPQSAPSATATPFEMGDLNRFWRAYDEIWATAPRDTVRAAAILQRVYLDSGSVGVTGFIPYRIVDARNLARAVLRRRAEYDHARARAAMLDTSTVLRQGVERARRRLLEMHPEAKPARVYFVAGTGNTGGTVQDSSVIIGVEVALAGEPDPRKLVALIAHELVHTQQAKRARPTVLVQSVVEGTADFMAELTSGRHTNDEAFAYGRAHEAELWPEFCRALDSSEFEPWLYSGDPARGWPNDLGYFMGYRIAQEFYARAADKREAVRALLATTDGRDIFAASGLAERCGPPAAATTG